MAGMEEELDRNFKRRDELNKKMEEMRTAIAAATQQVCVCVGGGVGACMMRIYKCMRACLRACLHECTYLCTYVHTYVRICVNMFTKLVLAFLYGSCVGRG